LSRAGQTLPTAAAADHANDFNYVAIVESDASMVAAGNYLPVHGNGNELRRHVLIGKKGV
jgi:hypothetical protein